jgi:HEPN domain-containing protein
MHCQHAVEKTLKAALAMRNIIITREHIVSPEFVRVYSDWDKAEKIGLLVSALEKEGTRTEYPFFGRPDLPIWIPSERYDRADAEDALAKAKYVFEVVGALLREAYEV